MVSEEGSQIDPGGAAGLATGSRSFSQKAQDWIKAAIADALAKRGGRTSLKVNGTQIGVRQHLDVQMTGATGEDHPELDLARVLLTGGGGGGGGWVELATHTVPTGSGEASIDFSSISQSYKALVAVGDNIQYETFTATNGHPICFQANGWTGNDYLDRVHRFGDSGGTLHDVVAPTAGNAGTVGYAPGPAGDEPVGSFVCWFPGYTNGNNYKTYHGHGAYSFGTVRIGLDTGGFVRLGLATHVNIDQLTFYAGLGPGGSPTDLFAPGSRITLYGVTAPSGGGSGLGRCSIYLDRGTSFTFTTNVVTTVTLDTADIDPDGWHSGNTIVVPETGDYLIYAFFAFDYISPLTISPTQWDLRMSICINGNETLSVGEVQYKTDLDTNFGKWMQIQGMLHLTATNAVSMKVRQTSGNTGTYNGSFGQIQSVPRLSVVKVA